MNILIVTDKLFPDEVGGSCTYAYETAISLNKMGNDVDIFTSHPEKIYNNKFFGKINLYRCLNKKKLYNSALKIQKLINSKDYDHIIFHSPIAWFIYYLAKPKINYRINEYGVFHGPWHSEAKLKYMSKKEYHKLFIIPIMKYIEYKYALNVKKFIFLSNYMRNELIRICDKSKDNNYAIIPGGVNIKKYERNYSKQEAKRKLGLKEEDFVIFSLRRLEYRMGLQVAIEAMDKLEIENVKYIIGGRGPFEAELKKRAKKLKNAKCIFTGFIPDDELNLYFCAADLFLVPSIDLEGFGLVVLESLASGVPVLATPQGGMKEYGNKISGFYLTEGFSSKDIADSISKIYKEISKNNFDDLEISSYDWSNITYRINRFLLDSGEIK